MATKYHLDYETRSRADLKKVGAARYASDPSTRILMFAIRKENGPTLLWLNPAFRVPCATNAEAWTLYAEALNDPEALIYAHNAPFEMFVAHYRNEHDLGLPAIPIEKLRCTMAMARKAGLRVSLDNVGEDLGLSQMKFGYGYQLIRKFSIPQKKTGEFIEPSEEPEKFIEFGRYCVRDVDSEAEAHAHMQPFELRGMALETFLFDLRMNLRGFPVNRKALEVAQRIIEKVQTEVREEFVALTGLEPTQRDRIKEYLKETFGIELANMQGKTIDKFIAAQEEDEDEAEDAAIEAALVDLESRGQETLFAQEPTEDIEKAMRVLELYKQVRFAAVKKVKTMLDCVCDDGFIRGMFTWHGAGTGRWTAQKVQPQNFRTPKISDPHGVYEMLCNGCTVSQLEMLYGNPLEAIADCVRNFIHHSADGARQELPMLDADYSAIEARIVAWLANESWRLEVFRTHGKIYEASASQMFHIPLNQITKPLRQRGKVAELALGYQGSDGAMKKMGALEMGLKEDELLEIVQAWRAANRRIVNTWYALERAAKAALFAPNTPVAVCDGKIEFKYVKVGKIPYLIMRLPSGRNIAYPHPNWTEDEGLTYYGQLKGKNWGRVSLYGGKILENATQGIAADFMGHGAVNAEKLGYIIWALIHDQALAAAQAGRTIEGFVAALTKLPPWANGMPLKADGEVVPFYTKLP